MHLSCKINSYKTELVHNHQPLIVPVGISVKSQEYFLVKNYILSNFCFLGWKRKGLDYESDTFLWGYFQECRLALFYGEGSQLWDLISQVFVAKNTKFLCSIDWKFPEFFKTHPTFICSSFLGASRSIWTLTGVFFETPCTYLQNVY